ncbi:ANTH domain-containing protein [Podospora conica]|nr:ANTH domain-containing protein [Schizothecium conicum]
MASSFEKSVKGATKIKAAPPKTKYIEHILVATHSGDAGVGEVFRALQYRIRDSTWTVVFKSLITVHLMIREGSPDVTLAYLAKHRNTLAVSMFSDAQTQGRNIRHYSNYLTERARAYKETKIDWVRGQDSRLEKLSVDKGLLRETEVVQHQLTALLKCDVMENEPENEITVTVFRLLVLDLLALFQALNQAMINILGHFFEMSKTDAERAMDIYRTFTRQTDFVVQYLSIARQFEHHTRVEVPELKHAPVNLGRQLEEYLKDPDFEIHRRQYLAELEAKKLKGGSASGGTSKRFDFASKSDTSKAFSSSNGSSQPPRAAQAAAPAAPKPAPATKGPDADLIDFFESIEQNQTPMAVQAQQQPQPQVQIGMSPWGQAPFQAQPTQQLPPNGFAPQPTGFQPDPFAQQAQQQQAMGMFVQQQQQQPMPQVQQPAFTGAGFGGFSPQPAFQPSSLGPIPQDSVASFQTGAAPGFQGLSPQQTTNPFRQSMLQQQTGSTFSAPSPTSSTGGPQRSASTQSTNPFARSSPQAAQPFTTPTSNSPFQSASPLQQLPPQQQPQQMPTQAPAPALQPAPTGTNPFAKNFAPSAALPAVPAIPQQQQQQAQGLISQPTGTNPFRQGVFVNHATGMGWQHNQAPIGGGLDQVQTIEVFPRPAQQTPWQQ